jgi:hypothetical protein
MKKFAVFLCTAVLVFGAVGAVSATVVDFDDVTALLGERPIPTNYKDLTWTGFAVTHDDTYNGMYSNTVEFPSGNYAAFNREGALSISLNLGDDFDFIGAYFAALAEKDVKSSRASTSITVWGYNDGKEVDFASMDLSTSFGWFQVGLEGVDQIDFVSSGGGKYWLMDDLTFTPAPVPEPATMLLVGAGLIGLAGVGRRKFVRKT